MDLMNNPDLQANLEKLKKKSEGLRPTIRKQIINEKVNLQTYMEWLMEAKRSGIDAGAVTAELKAMTDPEYAEKALANLRQVWLDRDDNALWLEKEIDRRVKALMGKPTNETNKKIGTVTDTYSNEVVRFDTDYFTLGDILQRESDGRQYWVADHDTRNKGYYRIVPIHVISSATDLQIGDRFTVSHHTYQH